MSSDNPISIPLGIVIGLLASCVQSFGMTIQRKSHVLNQSLPEHLQRVEHRRPLWLLGFAVFLSSNILGSFVQIASLPVVILAPLGAVSLLWNAFFARFLLGDVFSPWMILGTILVAGGAILIAVFGIVPEQTHSLEDLLRLFRRPTFIAYFSIIGFVLSVSLVITHAAEFSLARRVSNTRPSNPSSIDLSTANANLPTHTTGVTTGLADEINDAVLPTERTPLLDRKFGTKTLPAVKQISDLSIASIHRTHLILAISYASFSGIISGMCLLFAKSGVELLLLTLRGKNQFWRWEAWCLVLGLVAFALLQLWYLHKGLVLADPTIVCPSAFCLYNLSSIVNGLVYFDQFSSIPTLHLVLVSVGIVVLLGGVWVVSIQSGGGGVDVGTWDEEIVDLSAEEMESILEYETDEATSTTETMSLLEQPATNIPQERSGVMPMVRETRSESSMPNVSGIDKHGLGKMKTRISLSPNRHQGLHRAKTLYDSPRIPGQSTISSDLQHARISSSPSESPILNRLISHTRVPMQQSTSFHLPHSHGHPLAHGTLSPSLGPALQIGLSPVSPGFAILPMERKKTSAYAPGGDGGSGIAGSGRKRYWTQKMQRRRTISDGEVSRMSTSMSLDRQADRMGDEVEFSRESRVDGSEIEAGSSREDYEAGSSVQRTGHRWGWLTNFRPRWSRKD